MQGSREVWLHAGEFVDGRSALGRTPVVSENGPARRGDLYPAGGVLLLRYPIK